MHKYSAPTNCSVSWNRLQILSLYLTILLKKHAKAQKYILHQLRSVLMYKNMIDRLIDCRMSLNKYWLKAVWTFLLPVDLIITLCICKLYQSCNPLFYQTASLSVGLRLWLHSREQVHRFYFAIINSVLFWCFINRKL